MPCMPRPKGKARKIAYHILGVPANLRKQHKSPKDKKIDDRLVFEETQRVR